MSTISSSSSTVADDATQIRKGIRKLNLKLARLDDRLERAYLTHMRVKPIPCSLTLPSTPGGIHINGHHKPLYRLEGDFE